MSARILILTNSPLCRNPRVLKEATALGAAGHIVTVLGIRNHLPSVPIDRELVANAPFTHAYVDMLGHDAPLPRRFLVWLRRLQHRLAREFSHRLGLQSAASLGPARALLKATRARPADLLIVHNEIPHWVGAQLLAEGRRVAADIEDWHSEDLLPHERTGRPLALLRASERTLLHRAAYVTTTSQALAGALHTRYGGRRPEVITNSFPLQPTPLVRPAAAPAFFWFSQTTGPGRGLELFLAAWSRTSRPSRLVLLGEARSGYARRLLDSLPAHFRSRVEFLPLVPPDALPGLIARHDIGLALEQSFIVNRDLTITNKILQYLNAGLAVVASDTAGQREVLSQSPEAGLLVALHETTALAAQLDTLLADPEALARRRLAARRLAETRYSWEREAPHLLTLVAQALKHPST
ncbi:MAG TPA: glycosyltransferase [Opitutaceae bacterium]|nr:glycosyltransferase [Opitutaceae bacterium]HRJ45748.1 glycosyltransferase [Opitutaceae bacterium]